LCQRASGLHIDIHTYAPRVSIRKGSSQQSIICSHRQGHLPRTSTNKNGFRPCTEPRLTLHTEGAIHPPLGLGVMIDGQCRMLYMRSLVQGCMLEFVRPTSYRNAHAGRCIPDRFGGSVEEARAQLSDLTLIRHEILTTYPGKLILLHKTCFTKCCGRWWCLCISSGWSLAVVKLCMVGYLKNRGTKTN